MVELILDCYPSWCYTANKYLMNVCCRRTWNTGLSGFIISLSQLMSTSTMETFQISWMYSRNHCFKINDVWFINIIQLILELPRDEGVCIVQHENRTSLLKKPTEVLAKKSDCTLLLCWEAWDVLPEQIPNQALKKIFHSKAVPSFGCRHWETGPPLKILVDLYEEERIHEAWNKNLEGELQRTSPPPSTMSSTNHYTCLLIFIGNSALLWLTYE